MRRSVTALLLAGSLSLTACGPRYVPGTQIEMTDEVEVVVNLVERYRVAVEQRDAEALRSLASRRYYENGSTTNDPSDDYDYRGLEKVLSDLKSHVKDIKYNITIVDVQILNDEIAQVDYDYTSQYQYTLGEQDRWETVDDRNRLTFRNEDGNWRILNGM
ncbi:MAG: nuclear transport factor 2 family protein [Bradymonadia bacterium]